MSHRNMVLGLAAENVVKSRTFKNYDTVLRQIEKYFKHSIIIVTEVSRTNAMLNLYWIESESDVSDTLT